MPTLEINLVDLKPNSFGDFEYDFYPDRKFIGTEYIILFRKESWGHIQYFDKFFDCDKKNVQLICITSRNFFPICSNISHKCILYENDEKNFSDVINGIGESKYSFDHINFYKKYSIKYSQVLDITDKSQRRSIIFERPLWFAWELFEFLKNKSLYIEKKSFNLFSNLDFNIEKKSVIFLSSQKRSFLSNRFINDGLNILTLQDKILDDILKISGKNYFCTFQILLSLFFGIGYVGVNGPCNFLNMCIHTNCLFGANQAGDFSHVLSMARSSYNNYLYGISTNHYCNNEIYVNGRNSIDMYSGWRYECIKESILNNKNVIIPQVNILN